MIRYTHVLTVITNSWKKNLSKLSMCQLSLKLLFLNVVLIIHYNSCFSVFYLKRIVLLFF